MPKIFRLYLPSFQFETAIPDEGDKSSLTIHAANLLMGIKGDQLTLPEVEQIIAYWGTVRDWWAEKTASNLELESVLNAESTDSNETEKPPAATTKRGRKKRGKI